MLGVRFFVLCGAFAVPVVALAHTGLAQGYGFWHGLMHPISGADHILAMLGVGVWAAALGFRSKWLVPAAFVSVMLLGAALGVATHIQPFEFGIVASVLLIGLLIAFRTKMPAWAAMLVVGVFAFFHGTAHGAELPASSSVLTYFIGFGITTAALHVAGIALGTFALSLNRLALPAIGTATVAAGFLLLLA